ncbi:MAG: 2-succinyl-5-enolpyruvyl-6-hydroxy-3-cyclohexene-1-carboxylic-acid synthase [Balneolaceae bacterium]|nr:MAG: 2-succinyl-5-enolpyruvyl-6-hydroxy-3-cyclohexene-1-carboxylic-acid synthase [Balneolaceae bacterium]
MHNPLQRAAYFIDALYHSGVKHAVISPGSRSTPLTLAAAMHPGLTKKVVLDERSAAFMALGIGKESGSPAALICTSGTAVANYMPAVTEAKESGTPMIILSADRPPNLRGIGSSQTVDQIKIFGDQAVFFHEAGEPALEYDDIARLKLLSRQAVESSIKKGGAAHINLPFRKPLEPTSVLLNEVIRGFDNHKKKADPVNTSSATIHPDEELTKMINQSEKILIIAGPSNPQSALNHQLTELSNLLNCPVIAEPGSSISDDHIIDRFDSLLRNGVHQKELKPDLILHFGDQPFTKPILSAIEHWDDVPIIQFLGRDTWQDHFKKIQNRIVLNSNDFFDIQQIKAHSSGKWLKSWQTRNDSAADRLETFLKNSVKLTDGHIFNSISKKLPKNWNVMLSNSYPVRDMAQFGFPLKHQFVNRGAAGIDGILSTAAGVALSSSKPVCCFIGDLAFLHDSNALFSLKQLPNPVVAVVINNGGGTIFNMLPVYKMLKDLEKAHLFEEYFLTPQDVDIQFLANASKLPYMRVERLEELDALNLQSMKNSTIVECVTDAAASMNLRESL